MSVRAMTWVWENSTATGNELLLLLAIADAADDHGRKAYPSIKTLSEKTRLSRRTVQRLISQLGAGGHLKVQDGGGRFSNSYTLLMEPTSSGASPDKSDSASSTRAQEQAPQHQTGARASTTGVSLTQRQSDTGAVATSPQQRHSCDAAGVSQLCHPTHPVPVLEPSTTDAADRQAAVAGAHGGGGHQPYTNPSPADAAELADEVLAALGPAWDLGKTSRRRLQAPLRQALEAGWSPEALAAHLGANPTGVRNPYAVLAARLGDLPSPPARPKPWPDWCGRCHAETRLIDLDDDRVAHCPTCHPKASQP